MGRIASHLVGMGAYGLDLGTFSPFLYAFREREMILDLFEEVCGARLTYSYVTVGGVHDDLPDGWVERCAKFVDYLKPRIDEYHALLTNNAIFIKRTANIGVCPKELAISHACSGPMLRGSLNRDDGDPEWDLRKTEPYCGYDQYDFKVIIPPFPEKPPEAVIGDCWHRYYVRMLEVVESIKLVPRPDTMRLEITISDGTGEISGVWFGHHRIAGLELGERVAFEGMIGSPGAGKLEILHPTYQLLGPPGDGREARR